MIANTIAGLLGAGALAVAAITSAGSVGIGLASQDVMATSGITVDAWQVEPDRKSGDLEITSVTLSGIPQSSVGTSVTVYLEAAAMHEVNAMITKAGSVVVPIDDVPAAGLHRISVVVSGR